MRKKATFGLEVEFLILDEAGQVTNSADLLLEKCRGRKMEYHVRPEAAKCMIEMGAKPKPTVRHTAKGFLRNLDTLFEQARKLDLWLFPLATYPGQMVSALRTKPWYDMQTEVIGEQWVKAIGCITGFHFHNALPKGVMDSEKGMLKSMRRGAAARLLVNQFNLLVAADPAAATLMQSSPFFDGKFYCKDTRVAIYRDLEFRERGMSGMYSRNSAFGALPRYAHTIYDLDHSAKSRKALWLRELAEKNPALAKANRNAHAMRFYWGPVRINKVGTFEQRGMDMNLPKYMLGTSTVLKRALLGVERDGLTVTPSEIGVRHPFKVEGSEIFVPPHSYVVNYLTRKSVVQGLASPAVREYVRRLYNFAVRYLDDKPDLSAISIKRMLEDGKTVSDKVMAKLGVRNSQPGFQIDQDAAGSVALEYAENFEKEISELRTHYILLDRIEAEEKGGEE